MAAIAVVLSQERPDGFDLRRLDNWDLREAVLTDEHAAASYGLPVLVVDGVAHGPADLPGHPYLYGVPEELCPWAEAAGWLASTTQVLGG